MARDFSESSHMESDNVDDQGLGEEFDDDAGIESLGRNQLSAESRTLESQRKLHETLEQQVAQFLANGGTITEVESSIASDPPRKPVSRYGSRPI
ncbi:hypothetical protein [Aestuariirhabdus sp. LZHN29]|uniref:hypothetical protein n=1 Tax=Aestuariirhabdus sp. LZHN29 TaxID=3417462 RepID=UPI003CF45D48